MKLKHGLLFGAVAVILAAAFTVTACNDDGGDDGPPKAAAPTANPPAGAVGVGTPIELATPMEGAEIWYTLDGSAPTAAAPSVKYVETAKPVINAATTLKAIAVKEGMNNSDALTAEYTAKVAAPTANPPAGAVGVGTPIELATTMEGAEIWYTLDGSAPAAAAPSVKYGETAKPVINAATTLKAIAIKTGIANSDVLTAEYTIDANKPSMPTINPPGGNVDYGTTITLTTTTRDAEIYYTIDGSDPTTSSTKIRGSTLEITASQTTIKAATHTWTWGGTDRRDFWSGVLTATYTVDSIKIWTYVNSTFVDNAINSVCYGGGKFVAVGNRGKMAYSEDGVTWRTAVVNSTFGTDFDSSIRGVCYGDGKFVAVGNSYRGGRIAYSEDGVSWTAVADSTFGASQINGVCYGGGKFLAVGNSGKMAYSADGVSWTAGANSTFGTDYIYGVCYGGGKFVAVGNSGKMAYSSDGVSWTAVANSTFGTAAISSVCYGGGKFVAGGDDKMAYSSDGVSWTAVAFGGYINGVCYGGGRFVAVGGTLFSSKILYSNPQE
ncbi:MAG: chitobiase/beta-hexosaminidase C-terminal domain-containing protein [Spirochaetaceae bacterium]|jgi:hypothetical protein|nr:chitobiase/beta-hexosaminidase C-terminal domain-containing protein [Spirochaetaceae bacterium]